MKVDDFVYLCYGSYKYHAKILKMEIRNDELHLYCDQKNEDGSISKNVHSYAFTEIEMDAPKFSIPLIFHELQVGVTFRYCGGNDTLLVVMDSGVKRCLNKVTNHIHDCVKEQEVYKV